MASSKQQQNIIDELMPSDEDLLYEEELLRNPYSLKMWWRYIQARSGASPKRRYLLYERALKALPGSYKVSQWSLALMTRRVVDRSRLCRAGGRVGTLRCQPSCLRAVLL